MIRGLLAVPGGFGFSVGATGVSVAEGVEFTVGDWTGAAVGEAVDLFWQALSAKKTMRITNSQEGLLHLLILCLDFIVLTLVVYLYLVYNDYNQFTYTLVSRFTGSLGFGLAGGHHANSQRADLPNVYWRNPWKKYHPGGLSQRF
jgi:hypothetical protein